MNLRTAESIFAGISQILEHDPGMITPIGDRVLIRDLGPLETPSALELPETARDNAKLRVGLVVAVGAGDRYSEHGLDAEGNVRRRLLTKPCTNCKGPDGTQTGQWFNFYEYRMEPCIACKGEKRVPVVVPPQCQVGERVIYDRRREAEYFIDGQRYVLLHAEQSVIGVVED